MEIGLGRETIDVDDFSLVQKKKVASFSCCACAASRDIERQWQERGYLCVERGEREPLVTTTSICLYFFPFIIIIIIILFFF